ncbi:MAG: EamA family transporter [Sphingomonadales bacterium]|nr:EamA family transporter [Sphingomonadales bacterium]
MTDGVRVSQSPMMSARVMIPFAVATIIWGSTWLVIRGQLGVVPPTWSVCYRFLVGAVAMFVYALATRASLRLDWRGHAFAALIGLAQFCLNFNFVYRAEGLITSGLVAVVFALLVVPNAIFGRIFLKQPVTGRFLFGSLVALIGVGLLILKEARADVSSGHASLVGVGLTLLGVLSASVSNVLQGADRARSMSMAAMLAWGMLWGALINAIVAWLTVGAPVIEMTMMYLSGTLYLGVFASAIAFTCYFGVIRVIGPARAAYSSVMTPVLAMILSTVFERYHWTVLAVAGGVVTFTGLTIALSARKPIVKSA